MYGEQHVEVGTHIWRTVARLQLERHPRMLSPAACQHQTTCQRDAHSPLREHGQLDRAWASPSMLVDAISQAGELEVVKLGICFVWCDDIWDLFGVECLDELEGHLGRDVDTFDIMFPCLIVVALLGQGLGNCKVLIPFMFPLDLCPFLCRSPEVVLRQRPHMG